MRPLITLFMGTPDFAVPPLQALLKSPSFDVRAVYTQSPKPAGRGYAVQKSPVHQVADAHGMPVLTPEALKDEVAFATYRAFKPEIVVVAAYGFILPKRYLEVPEWGCINVHASLLPRWRGASPIQWAILAGDKRSGVSIMRMEPAMDTGPVLVQKEVLIDREMTGGELYHRLSEEGGRAIVPALEDYVRGILSPIPQPLDGITLAPKISKEDVRLQWSDPAEVLHNKIRAFNPTPGAYFLWHEERIKILAADVLASRDGPCVPGTVLNDRLHIQCGMGVLAPLIVQRPGKTPMDVKSFLRGYPVPLGTRLELSDAPL